MKIMLTTRINYMLLLVIPKNVTTRMVFLNRKMEEMKNITQKFQILLRISLSFKSTTWIFRVFLLRGT